MNECTHLFAHDSTLALDLLVLLGADRVVDEANLSSMATAVPTKVIPLGRLHHRSVAAADGDGEVVLAGDAVRALIVLINTKRVCNSIRTV